MPISTAPEPPAAEAAFREAKVWVEIAERWRPDRNREIWEDLPGFESAVIPEVDPTADLAKRAGRWSYPLGQGDLADLALFAAALAQTEGEAWAAADRSLATRALEERRFLAADRVLPWAIPWLRALADCFPESREDATAAFDSLLEIGERHRPAPYLARSEGLSIPGHDGYGPCDGGGDLGARVESLWGGLVVFRRSLESISGAVLEWRRFELGWVESPTTAGSIMTWYETAATYWESLAGQYPGSARYWIDLGRRALVTAELAKPTG